MIEVRVLPDLAGVDPAAWNALSKDNPFTTWAFLRLLEESGSVGPSTGWMPAHVVATQAGRLAAAVPLYVRTDSWGEYIFDWGWAEAAQRAKIPYYPKLSAAVPFTPATGPRLLGDPALRDVLVAGIEAVRERMDASSAHVLFCEDDEQAWLAGEGWLPRLSMQFHWDNPGWRDFQDFAAALTRKRRHEMNRERRQVRDEGIEVRVLRGAEIGEADMAALYGFYLGTVHEHGQYAYLSRAFWEGLLPALGEAVVAVIATREGERVAGALNLCAGSSLFGRYWGCREAHRALHFEVCYYALLEWALQHGIRHFEAGAQGEHKLQRGFLPVLTRSAHRVAHPQLRDGIARFVRAEAERVRLTVATLREHSPYKEIGG